MYDKKQSRQENQKTAPPYPEICSKTGCDHKTDIVFIRIFDNNKSQIVVDGFGKREYGVGKKKVEKRAFGYVNNGVIVMNEQFDFRGWITRCGGCYSQDLKSYGKGVASTAKQINQGESDKVNKI